MQSMAIIKPHSSISVRGCAIVVEVGSLHQLMASVYGLFCEISELI